MEKVVLAGSRPVLEVTSGSFDPPPAGMFEGLAESKGAIERVLRSTGRIDLSGPPSTPTVGTGVLVGGDLLITTRRVAATFSEGIGRRNLRIQAGFSASVVFQAGDPEGERRSEVVAVELIHPVFDIAVLRIEPGSGRPPVELSARPIERPEGRKVVTLGVASFDLVSRALTEDAPRRVADPPCLRVLPGELVGSKVIASYGKQVWAFLHDCTTTSMTAGAPLVDLETGQVIAIHLWGRPLEPGHALPTAELTRDVRVVDLGLAITDGQGVSTHVFREDWETADPAEPREIPRPVPRTPAQDAGKDIDRFDRLVRERFPAADEFVNLLQSLGGKYVEALEAVPRHGPEDRTYRRGLLKALSRRSLLDESLEAAISGDAREPTLDALAEQGSAVAPLGGLGQAGLEAIVRVEPSTPPVSETLDIGFLSRGLEAARSVGMVRASLEGREFGSTGWLLTASLIVVPAHVLQSDTAVEAVAYFDFDEQGHRDTGVAVERIELWDRALDLAVLRLAAPLTGRRPLTVDPRPTFIGNVVAIHHPALGPKRISLYGRILEHRGLDVVYELATEPGSGGAPIFATTWHVIATHKAVRHYRMPAAAEPVWAKVGTSSAALVDRLRDSALWPEVVAAQPLLKAIDPALEGAFFERESRGEPALVPVLIEAIGKPGSFEDVPEMTVISRTGRFVTAFIGRGAVAALRQRADVLALEVSRPAASAECAVTLPHIGVPIVQQNWHEQGDAALIGVVDNGIDIFHRSFQTADGKCRVVAFWDQKHQQEQSPGAAAPGVFTVSAAGQALAQQFDLTYGAVYAQSDLQGFIDNPGTLPSTYPGGDRMAHGTSVCSILAGRRTGEGETDFTGGIAPGADLIVVRYDLKGQKLGYANSHIDALRLIDGLASQLGKPVVVNISNGMNAGAHDGTSRVEACCDQFTGQGQTAGRVIVKSAGNERGMGRHARLKVPAGLLVELRWKSLLGVDGDPGAADTIELWFDFSNQYAFRIKTPDGGWSPEISPEHPSLEERLPNGNAVSALYAPYNNENGDSSLHIKVSPGPAGRVADGQWVLEISGRQVRNGKVIDAWIEEMPDRDVSFQDDLDDEVSITIPGTARHVITVGAVEVGSPRRAYEHSSRGPTRKGVEKPEIVAPGVKVRTAQGGTISGRDSPVAARSGTSIAAPHVAGVIALALSTRAKQAGKPQLNTVQIRSMLIASARNPGDWNEITGYGEIDAEAFFRQVDPVT